MTRTFAVVSEARADFVLATELADRVIVDAIGWLEEPYLDSQRQWIGNESDGAALTWKSIKGRAGKLGIMAYGHFDGVPGTLDAAAARRAIAYLRKIFPRADAILLVRDLDDQPRRRQGLEQARNISKRFMVVIGVAVIERESWVLSGFVPETDSETERLNAEINGLAFHPCEKPHDLKAGKNDQASRSPKRVLKVLTSDNWERQRKCWVETPLAALEGRGRDNGLVDYMNEVRERLVPFIASVNEV